MKLKMFSNMRISWLLAGGYVAMFVLLVSIGITAFWSTERLSQNLDRVFIGVPVISGLSTIKSDLARAQALEVALKNTDAQSEVFDEALMEYGMTLENAIQNWGIAKDTVREHRGGVIESETENEEFRLSNGFDNALKGWTSSGMSLVNQAEKNPQDAMEAISGHLFDATEALAKLESFYLDDAQTTSTEATKSREGAVKVLAVVSIIGFVTAIFLSISITRIITRPLSELSIGVSRMAKGQLGTRLNTKARTREMKLLMEGFSAMVATLRDQVSGLSDGANTIAVSTSQISTTATELAATASEASISVNQITTTAEEVKQTVQLSTEKANQVAEAAEEVARVADQGRMATEEAVSGMSRIKEEMEYIAESIVKLSEQTQSIGEIIDAVNDLANESNLLSVNASIEAAKAGEFGKGFAVVAQEVKSLSDLSKQATAQVRTILNDIQNATSQAVMATERGSKAVDNGVDLASSSGHAIRALSESMSESANSAAQIAASSRQQLAGMDQLAQAMGSIQDAAEQNVEGAKRLEDSTHDLSKIADTLKELANRFEL
ncbi:MAG: methyl-accepting chemotaxis protein [Desulfatibacillum sp.]|nr:methyl-accepting chemotaxis protein [Desulfatibacillum sp.]